MYRNIVFKGGGIKGLAYAGALRAMGRHGMLRDVRRTAGTSSGAMAAVFLALGATPDQMVDILLRTPFHKFMDGSRWLGGDLQRLVRDFGWFKGEVLERWARSNIGVLTGKPHMTFGELRQRAEVEPGRFLDLTVVGANLSRETPELFNAERTPDTPIHEALRISMSIPLFFTAVRNSRGEVLVDGSVIWNYPISLYDRARYVMHGDHVRGDAGHGEAGRSGATQDAAGRCDTSGWNVPPRDASRVRAGQGDAVHGSAVRGEDGPGDASPDACGRRLTGQGNAMHGEDGQADTPPGESRQGDARQNVALRGDAAPGEYGPGEYGPGDARPGEAGRGVARGDTPRQGKAGRGDAGQGDACPHNPDAVTFNRETLGFMVESRHGEELLHHDVTPVADFRTYLRSILGFITDSMHSAYLSEHDWKRTVLIDALGVRTTDFQISREQVRSLIDSGDRCVEAFIASRKGYRDGGMA
ncbi:patatin-like phospholipase family protein [Nitratidesulfovibrio vulgaris]|uniref:patatin-like phospholipase family protein n=1 Tax=Nitratidesulfovibrio vulgaris TaxID=881 RepID=UPI0013DE8036|nr:patatin-like phospholipase family protein [Nitratidesulfovibrio vulgaris]